MGMGTDKRRPTNERLVHIMKELDRLEKRIKLGGKVCLAGAVLSVIGIIAALILALVTRQFYLLTDAVLMTSGLAVFAVGMCIMPSPTALMIARNNALFELRMHHAIKDARKSG